jgi:hypothetical protein
MRLPNNSSLSNFSFTLWFRLTGELAGEESDKCGVIGNSFSGYGDAMRVREFVWIKIQEGAGNSNTSELYQRLAYLLGGGLRKRA